MKRPGTTDRRAPSAVRDVLSPEARVLLATAARDRGPLRVADQLREDLEWGRLYGIALRERAAGPLWRGLAPFEDRLPREFAAGLEQAAAVEGLRQEQLRRRLAESVATLRRAGLNPLLLKGAALLQTHYSEVRQRPMADIDLLVPPGDASRARRVLMDAGWEWNRERFPDSMYDRHYHLPPLQDGRGGGIGLEIHTGLLLPGHPFSFGPEELAASARRVEVGGEEALVPSPRGHLLHVCLHFAWSHGLGSGGWRAFRDVGVLSDDGEFGWSAFARAVEDAGAEASAYWTLRLAGDLAGIDVPGSVLEDLRPPLPGALLTGLGRHYALELFPEEASCPSVRLRHLLWLLGNGSGRGGVRGLLGDGATRPWDFSGDFAALEGEGRDPEGGRSRLGRHLDDRNRWRSYLRKVALRAGTAD